jgi:hypothetical protein
MAGGGSWETSRGGGEIQQRSNPKGHVRDFDVGTETVAVEDPETHTVHKISIDELKAIFFVKTFKGRSEYIEKKVFGIRKNPGRKVFVKLKDNEVLVGYIDGDIPWVKGFSLAKEGNKAKGFFLILSTAKVIILKCSLWGLQFRCNDHDGMSPRSFSR